MYSETLNYLNRCRGGPPNTFSMTSNRITEAGYCQSTRFSSQSKLVHQQAYSRRSRHFYFNRLPRLWNSLPRSISNSPTRLLIVTYETTYGITLSWNLTPTEVAHSTTFVHVSVVVSSSTHPPFNLWCACLKFLTSTALADRQYDLMFSVL